MNINIGYLADHPEFISQIATWYFTEWGHKESGVTEEGIRERLYTKLNKGHAPIPIVARVDENLVGTAQLKIREMDIYPDKEFWLGGVYVDSKARKQSVGKLLATRVEEIARQLEIKEIYLQTANLTGGLYAKLGWMPLEQIKHQGTNVLLMYKEL